MEDMTQDKSLWRSKIEVANRSSVYLVLPLVYVQVQFIVVLYYLIA